MVAIMRRHKELPTTRDIYMNHRGLMGFKLSKNNTLYKFDELDHDIDKLMSEHTGVFGEGPHAGHNVHSMLRGLVQHVNKVLPMSEMNTPVYDVFTTNGARGCEYHGLRPDTCYQELLSKAKNDRAVKLD
eukprot:jgi/Chrzof1/14282/Cz08g31340.t1